MSHQHKEEFPKIVIALFALAMTAISCTTDRPTLLATIDNQSITLTDFAIRLSQIPQFRQATPAQQQAAAQATLESLIDDKILYLEAKAFKIQIEPAQVEHAIRQHEALLGKTLLSIFTHQRGVSQKTLRRFYEQELSVVEYLKQVQIKERPFCDGFVVQSSQNCIKRQDFMKSMRTKHPVLIKQGAATRALDELVGSAR
jgi:hypothetical protein